MDKKGKYYVVREKAIPEVLLKVVEAKLRMEQDPGLTVTEAARQSGISRTSFYKYKDDIFQFNDSAKGKTITFAIQISDSPGLLSRLLGIVAGYHANILTIHQSIPLGGVAGVSLSAEIREDTGDVAKMMEEMENQEGILDVKILARE